jgi:hypothetical protein
LIPVARISKADGSKPPIYEIFPYVKFSSQSNPNFQTFLGEKRLVDGSVRQYFSGDEVVTRGVISSNPKDFEEFIEAYSRSVDAFISGSEFSTVEKRAFLLCKLLRRGIANSHNQSNKATIGKWLTSRSENSFQMQEMSTRDKISTKLLLQDLVGTRIHGFYRRIDKADLNNWGIPSAVTQWDFDLKTFEISETQPVSQFLWVSVLSYAMSTSFPLSFSINFDWELGRSKLNVFREIQRGKILKIGQFIPQLGTGDVDRFANATEQRQSARDFLLNVARHSAPILEFLNGLLQLDIQPDGAFENIDISNQDLECETSREALEIYEKTVSRYTESKYGIFPNLFLFSACFTGQGRILEEYQESKSIHLLMNSFLGILKLRITYEGNRDPRSRLANIFFHLFPQISLNDQKRVEKCTEIASSMSEDHCKLLTLGLIRAGSAHEFFNILLSQRKILDFEELAEMQETLITKLAETRNRKRTNAHSKSITEMHDGLYNTYGAER